MTNDTVLVASPSAMGRTPVASGSSVPACPALAAAKARLTTDTAWVDVMPIGLSRMSQPLTLRFSRRRWVGGASPGGGGGDGGGENLAPLLAGPGAAGGRGGPKIFGLL